MITFTNLATGLTPVLHGSDYQERQYKDSDYAVYVTFRSNSSLEITLRVFNEIPRWRGSHTAFILWVMEKVKANMGIETTLGYVLEFRVNPDYYSGTPPNQEYRLTTNLEY